ncbi:MAG: protein kinase [Myxococcales bacterium]|nr:protein kinase [Myxococcales bacterium]
MLSAAAAPAPGLTLGDGALFAGRYVIVRRIGSGGMGAVYEVIHSETKRRRALKLLLPILVSDPDARARFLQEATITADIESESLVETFDAGVDAATGCPFIVMELLRGESLGARLAAGRRLDPRQALEVLRQLAAALEKTHAAGVVHRDLKPDNLFLCEKEDGTVRVKVLDFGIAKIIQQASKSRNTVNIGTPLYMAPEQIDGGRIDRRADVYSLGHVAYELLTGESYWEEELRRAPSTLVLLRWMEGPLPEPPSVRAGRRGLAVGVAFDAWFSRATARRPADRQATATELVNELATALVGGMPALAPGPATRPAAGGDVPPPFPLPADTDAPTRVRQNPRDEASVRSVSSVRLDSSWKATSPSVGEGVAQVPPRSPRLLLALLAVSAAAAALAIGALVLTLAGGSAARPALQTWSSAPAAAGSVAPIATVIIPVPVGVESAAPSASSKPGSPPARSSKPSSPRTDSRCKREPERCR